MPSLDASQFVKLKKYSVINALGLGGLGVTTPNYYALPYVTTRGPSQINERFVFEGRNTGQVKGRDGAIYCYKLAVGPDKKVYYGNSASTVRCINGLTGNIIWSYVGEGNQNYEPGVVLFNNVLYFSSDKGIITAVNAQTGTLIWNYDTKTQNWPSNILPAINNAGTIVHFVYEGSLNALNLQTGTLLWKSNNIGLVSNPKILSDGNIISSIVGITKVTSTGDLIWTSSQPVQADRFVISSDESTIYGCVSVTNGTRVFAINGLDGNLLWSIEIETLQIGIPTLSFVGDTLFLGNNNGRLYAIAVSPTAGSVKWYYQSGSAIQGTPACGKNGDVYFGNMSGSAFCLTKTGNVKWVNKTDSATLFSPATLSLDQTIVYLGSGNRYGGVPAMFALSTINGLPI
jgi:outer membrane protein assembly factor BamB